MKFCHGVRRLFKIELELHRAFGRLDFGEHLFGFREIVLVNALRPALGVQGNGGKQQRQGKEFHRE